MYMVKSTLPVFVQFLPMTMSFSGRTSFTVLPMVQHQDLAQLQVRDRLGTKLCVSLDASRDVVLEPTPQAPM